MPAPRPRPRPRARARDRARHPALATIGEMSCNPAIGGLGQGPSGARDRRARRRDGPRRRRAPASSSACSTAARAPPSRGRAPRPTASSIGAPCRRLFARHAEPDRRRRRSGRGSSSEAGARHRRRARRRPHVACRAVVLTTGTFLRGMIHLGDQRTPAGRVGDAPSVCSPRASTRPGFSLGRLKTGTPPRLDGRTID